MWRHHQREQKWWWPEKVPVYFTPVKATKAALSGRVVPKTVDYESIKSWLSICSEKHSCGHGREKKEFGLFLIDCQTRHIIRLDEPITEYVALSYLWGADTTQSKTMSHVLPRTVPLVVEDAMQVAVCLGFRYLWVDRYCVPQDDNTEKRRQIENMGNIYTNASLTIIAAAGEDSEYGLPGVSSRVRVQQHQITLGAHHLVSTLAIKMEINRGKWNTRGWTYQEALLSTRRLVFTDSQLYYQCSSMVCLESIAEAIDLSQEKKHHDKDHSHGSLRVFPERGVGDVSDISERIREYNHRNFSFDVDALDAFQGIFRRFQAMEPGIRHWVGLPLFPVDFFVSWQYPPVSNTHRLSLSLMWEMKSFERRRSEFPSWTWLGWKGSSFNMCAFSPSYDFNNKKGTDGRYICPIRIEAEFNTWGDPSVYDVEEDFIMISTRIDAGQHPCCLHITAFFILIECSRFGPAYEWQIHLPRTLQAGEGRKRLEYCVERNLESLGDEITSLSLFGLVLAQVWRVSYTTLRLMIVHSDEGRSYYERFPNGYCEILAFDVQFYEEDDKFSFSGLELHKKTFRLG
jgi:hypothetical protein